MCFCFTLPTNISTGMSICQPRRCYATNDQPSSLHSLPVCQVPPVPHHPRSLWPPNQKQPQTYLRTMRWHPCYPRTQDQAKPSIADQQINPDLHQRHYPTSPTQPKEDNMNAEQRLNQAIAKLEAIQKRGSDITETEKMEITAELLVIATLKHKELEGEAWKPQPSPK